jgi:hypothetical protein
MVKYKGLVLSCLRSAIRKISLKLHWISNFLPHFLLVLYVKGQRVFLEPAFASLQ